MKLTVTGRRLVLSSLDRADIDRRVARLDRMLNDNAVSASCVVSRERGRFVCELTVHARGGHLLVGVGEHRRVGTATGEAADKVAQQAERLKDRWKGRRGQKPKAPGAAPAAASAKREVPARRVIRSKAYAVKPMTVEDAVILLAAGSETVLVFRHASTEALAVVYKRPDGHVGLIDPEA
jgi:putative sigma-54 modulation protein